MPAVRAEVRHTSRLSAVVRLSTLLRLPILLSSLEVKLTLHCLIVLALAEMSQVRLRKILDNNWLADCDGLRYHRIGDGQPTHSRLAGELQFLLEWSLDLRLGVQLWLQLQTQPHVLHCLHSLVSRNQGLGKRKLGWWFVDSENVAHLGITPNRLKL